jgi:hypothetical protein
MNAPQRCVIRTLLVVSNFVTAQPFKAFSLIVHWNLIYKNILNFKTMKRDDKLINICIIFNKLS